MVSVEITGIKEFMNKLLNSEAFDSFYLEEAVIATFNTFIIDGHLIKSDTDELPDRPDNFPAGGQPAGQSNGQSSPVYSTWKQLRPIVFSLIRGEGAHGKVQRGDAGAFSCGTEIQEHPHVVGLGLYDRFEVSHVDKISCELAGNVGGVV